MPRMKLAPSGGSKSPGLLTPLKGHHSECRLASMDQELPNGRREPPRRGRAGRAGQQNSRKGALQKAVTDLLLLSHEILSNHWSTYKTVNTPQIIKSKLNLHCKARQRETKTKTPKEQILKKKKNYTVLTLFNNSERLMVLPGLEKNSRPINA